MLQDLLNREAVRETEWYRKFGPVEDVRRLKAFKALENDLRAYAQRDADFIVLSMTCGDSKEAALIVNEMVDLFLSSQGANKREEISARLQRLEDKRVRLESELNAANDALDAIRNQYGFIDLEEREFQPTITQKLNNLEIQSDDLQMEIEQIETNMETLRRQATGPVQEQVERRVETDPVMLDLSSRLAELNSLLKGALTRFGENHKVVRELQRRIDSTRAERQQRQNLIAEQIRQSNYQDARDTLLVYANRMERLTQLREEAAAEQAELDRARVEYEKRVVIRDEIQERLDNTKDSISTHRALLNDPESPKVRFVGYAPEPIEMSSPRIELYLPGGMMLGLMSGAGLAFLRELLNDLLRTPRDVGRHLDTHLLGIIPDASEDEQARNIDLFHIVRQAPYSVTAESYRRLRANLKLSGALDESNVLLVTSGMAGDGKTSVAANLATTLAGEGNRILLIDTNFWRPAMHKVFGKDQVRAVKKDPAESLHSPAGLLALA